MPDADTPVKADPEQPPSQQAPDVAPEKTIVPAPLPPPPPPPPPAPTSQQAEATTTSTAPAAPTTPATPITPLISTAATVSSFPPPSTPAPATRPALNQLAATPTPALDAQSPSVQIEQLLASTQDQTDALVHQSPSQALLPQPTTSQATADPQAPTNPSPEVPATAQMSDEPNESKRPRSPDLEDEDNLAKRLKMEFAQHEAHIGQPEQAGHGEVNGHENEMTSLDLEAILSSALAEFETTPNPEVNVVQNTNPIPTTPEAEKTLNKIANFSRYSLYHMRSMSLLTLGSFAVQILVRLSQNSKADTDALLAQTESEFHKAYGMLRNVFESTRKMYSDSPLLSVDELEITDSEDRETIRMSNLASVAGLVFGAGDVTLKDVHDSFFSVFIPEDGEYKDSLTELLVSLKTRLFLDALNQQPPQPALGVLDNLFPARFDEVLKNRSGDLALNPDEERLVGQIRERRELLVQSAADESIKKSLAEQSSPDRISELLSLFLQGHLAVIVDYARNYGVNIPTQEEEPVLTTNMEIDDYHDSIAEALRLATAQLPMAEEIKDLGSEDLSGQHGDETLKKLLEQELAKDSSLSHDLSGFVKDSTAGQHDMNSTPADLANLVAAALPNPTEEPPHGLPTTSSMMYSGTVGTANAGHATTHPHYIAQMNQQHQNQYQTYTQSPAPAAPAAPAAANENGLPPNQSLPTAALYEKARQAAVAKSSNTSRREGLHSTRRPWSPEEEKALMAGLDMVKGPHWSQILGLFGPNGSISTILRDRTQVQLKDKARNLKLFFLKTNSEMPYYLQHVTGELKTRAPSQAARKEAEEKARQNSQEEQAKLQGLMLLANGLQHNNQPVMPGPHSNVQAPRASPTTPGVSGSMNSNATTATSGGLPPVPISPLVKSEPQEHHGLPKVTSFPSIAPAPAPSTSMPPPSKPHRPAQQQQQQVQQPQQVQQNQQAQPQPSHQQHVQQAAHPQQLQQQQQQQQQQHQAQASQPPQPQQQTHQQHQQAPQQVQQQAQSQAQPHSHIPSPAISQPSSTPPRPAQPAQTAYQSQPQVSSAQPSPGQTPSPAVPGLPIPPNHHSTPDHQEQHLMDTLKAALAGPPN
ncbi:telomere repeat binding factor-domain-containing protein [Cercophora samala]|uniref:Telomere repeat binding factor-domain-containing protein n=1 Tax=Cercophora samala TaxID=330535 RepID=A0AA40D4N1_9PEZI|nr:telomere repeat binding factor-domain-containing protein [Cercophora samala]